MYASIKALVIKTSMVFNFFASNTISSCFLFVLFLIVDLYFVIPVVIAQIFNPSAELAMLIGIPTKEGKTKIETHLVTAEAKIHKCSI